MSRLGKPLSVSKLVMGYSYINLQGQNDENNGERGKHFWGHSDENEVLSENRTRYILAKNLLIFCVGPKMLKS